MKNILGFIIIVNFCCCTDNNQEEMIDNSSNEYLEITENFSVQEFEVVKTFILENGDRQTYRNLDNNNPHYSFDGFEAYLNAEIGQGNINNDPKISDFNEITLRDSDAMPQYYTIHIVRKGDIENEEIVVFEGMKEEKVYLLNPYEDDIDLMERNLNGYIEAIKNEINSH